MIRDGEVLYNKEVAKGIYLARVSCEGMPSVSRPGQFVMLRTGTDLDPLLRRPFSIFRVDKEAIEIHYKVVGRGTSMMAALGKGDRLSVMGPLGNGFFVPGGTKTAILVGGGIGLAGIGLMEQDLEPEKKKVIVGFRSLKEVPKDLIKDYFLVSTEDGSLGYRGTVLDLLDNTISKMGEKEAAVIYACGSLPMLKAVAKYSKHLKIRCQVLMESPMACGVGACQGCVIRTVEGYKRVCHDGPVFWGEDIEWEGIKGA